MSPNLGQKIKSFEAMLSGYAEMEVNRS